MVWLSIVGDLQLSETIFIVQSEKSLGTKFEKENNNILVVYIIFPDIYKS